ncbi:hypothetical protein [Symbioplanes lichenis]|uniref:hypothetical protein n=1 Tax=Symbioplanes lichenis TaxID=1629072 RepID=UPI002739683A|nr:hypothetical protein [Actinoplanes lichenis]
MPNAWEDPIAAWHDAVNGREAGAARAAMTDPVEVAGPRGAQVIAAEAFVEWIFRSGIRLRPLRTHPVDATTVVVEQEATWDAAPEQVTRVATLFRVRDGAVSAARRYSTRDEALGYSHEP